MDITLEMLKEMGIDDQHCQQILKAHTDSTGKWQRLAKEQAYHGMLREIGVADKYTDAVLRVTDFDKLQLNDGKLSDLDRLKAEAKTQWSDFISVSLTSGASVPQPPAKNLPDYDTMSDDEYYRTTIK